MRTWIWSTRLLIFPLCLSGCASTSTTRSGGAPKIRTVASVGDKPLPVVSGTPGSSLAAGKVTPELRVGMNGRVSGRVVDSQGRPVPNAQVRLAVGGAAGGRMKRATTDRSGAFTLRGLRAGSPYTVIAELEDHRGHLTGRSDVRAPDTDVRITLRPTDPDPEDGESPRPSTRVSSISNHLAPSEDSREDEDTDSARVNEEDLLPGPEEPPRSSASRRDEGDATESPSLKGAGWRRGESTEAASVHTSSKTDPDDAPVDAEMLGTAAAREVIPFDDDGENPLPPALERESPPVTPGRPDSNRAAPVEDGLPQSTRDEEASIGPPAEPRGRPRLPGRPPEPRPESIPGALAVSPESVAPPRTRVSASEHRSRSSTTGKRPTWREVAADSRTPGPLEGPGASLAASHAIVPDRKGPKRPRAEGRPTKARAAPRSGDGETFCRYDAKNRRIEDFRLPDLDGRPVHFRDLDADLVLIDFWGTWCDPCVKAVPHLVELQERLGPARLKVVGIACERGTPGGRAANVAKTAERLGINYPVLLSSVEGPCPLQEALHIQVFPTMILVDRQGQILWRDQGATPVTMARLDRVIATSTAGSSDVVRR